MKLGTLLLAIFPLTGCFQNDVKLAEVELYRFYCSVEDKRRFTHAEWEFRKVEAKRGLDQSVAVNLRRAYGAEELGVGECLTPAPSGL